MKTRLFKLHGSIDWRLHTNRDYGCVKLPLDKPDSHLKDANGKDLEGRVLPDLPIFVGTLNKRVQYGYGIQEVLYYDWFRRLPRQYQVIAMSGYGGRDNDINLRVRNWLWDKNRKLVLLYEDPEKNLRDLLSYVRPWSSQLVRLNGWLNNTKAGDVLEFVQEVKGD